MLRRRPRRELRSRSCAMTLRVPFKPHVVRNYHAVSCSVRLLRVPVPRSPDTFMSPGAASGSPYGAGVGMSGAEQPPKILLMGARRYVGASHYALAHPCCLHGAVVGAGAALTCKRLAMCV